jgi:hypothetical protein
MTRNIELLERTMQHINDHPESHKQSWWFAPGECGTAACFAGWAWMLAGNEPVKILLDRNHSNRNDVWEFREDVRKLLGLTEDEADTLFSAVNSRQALQLMVKDLVNGDELGDEFSYGIEDEDD